ncbi:hypothetical protein Q31b_52800 [Novipirellula aureliae]|uniref:Uncharacterized protein n=1 Tax=Novipirellula aureliae TaxID=2527966 RepID=A0A5C6DID4_9BACT|nr:hypothetical protein [Novipirellula aureliae]TWU35844.1 hypothetical protein Q31b_52800 [Novipirellula aureliae]
MILIPRKIQSAVVASIAIVLLHDTVVAQSPTRANRLFQIQRDQLSDALGANHPAVLAATARVELDRQSRTQTHSIVDLPKPDQKSQLNQVINAFSDLASETNHKSQLKRVVDAFNDLVSENYKLKRRILELEKKLERLEEKKAGAE